MAEQRADLGTIRAAFRRGAEQALRRVAEDVLGEAQRRAPHEEGTLAASGHIEPEGGFATLPDGTQYIEVVFSTVYAAAQHEGWAIMHSGGTEWRWEARHYSKAGTGPKYLEGPIKENLNRYERIVGMAIEVELQRAAR